MKRRPVFVPRQSEMSSCRDARSVRPWCQKLQHRDINGDGRTDRASLQGDVSSFYNGKLSLADRIRGAVRATLSPLCGSGSEPLVVAPSCLYRGIR